MWSDRYYYLNIYRNKSFSEGVSTNQLIEFISAIPELKKVGDFEFKNKEPFPFTQLLLLKAKSTDSWSGNDTNSKSTNLITIVCKKGEDIDFNELERVFTPIATYLNWTFINEETDDNIEDYVIWKPTEN